MAIIVTEDNYDGVPDGSTICGLGPTPQAARADLVERLEDEGYYTAEEAAYVRRVYGIDHIDVDYLRDLQEERRAMMQGRDDE